MFFLITTFSLAGAFTNVSYVDMLGQSINQDKRHHFFSINQIVSGIMVLSSAFLVKSLLSWKDYPENYAYMFFAGGTL